MYTDGKFTYIQAHPEEPPALYELKDGKPNLIQFEFSNGIYVAAKVLDSGYLAIGKQKLSFLRQNRPTSEVTAMPDPVRDPENAPPPAATVRNQTAKPPAFCPKNAQTWVIAGLSAVMVAAIALSGNGSKSKAPEAARRQAAVIDPSASRIAEYRNRLDEETRKLAAEQARLNQVKQTAAGSDPRVASAMQAGAPNPYATHQLPPTDDRQSAKRQL